VAVLADLINLLADLEQSLHVLGVDDPHRFGADLLQLADMLQPKVVITLDCVPFMTPGAQHAPKGELIFCQKNAACVWQF
jgi:hypothetical protein